MFTLKTRSIGHIVALVVLLTALLIPSAALADGEEPPVPEAPAGEVTEAPAEVQLPATTDIQDAASTEEAPADEATPLEEPAPTEDVAEVVELLAETGSVLLDENGEAVPLASEQAAAALANSDPWFDAGGGVIVGYSSGGTCAAGVTECHSSITNPIQSAINDARATGLIINIEAGSYYENIQVNRSVTLQGAGQDLTFIFPAVSDPDAGAACEYASCADATNTVILVDAPTVSIFDLTVNGNNPFISSGVSAGGVDIDSHNGIVTTNVVTNLTIQDVTVENVLTRGIQYGNGVGTIDIENNRVENVQGTAGAIGIFNRYGTGTIANNQLSHVGDAIAMNWGRGVQILNNTITDAWTGIHTDNTQGSDLISGNTMTNGKANSYGIFVFAPYNPVSVQGNTITGYDYGLTVSGNGYNDTLNTVTFEANTVNTNIAGVYLTSDVWGYFKSDVSAEFFNNVFTGGQYGMWLESLSGADSVPGYYGASDCTGDCVLSLTAYDNSFSGETLASVAYATGTVAWYGGAANYHGIYDVDASGNYWGTTDPTTLAGMMATGVDYSPWLHSGTDTNPGAIGFQGDFSALHVDDDSAVSGSELHILEGINMNTAGGTVFISPGTYREQLKINKSIALTGSGQGSTVITTPNTLVGMVVDPTVAAIVELYNAATVFMSQLTVSGPDAPLGVPLYFGAYVGGNSTLNLSHVTVSDIHDSPVFTGAQHGVAIQVGRQSQGQVGHALIEDSEIVDYQKNGITVDNAGSTATIRGTTITGAGPTAITAQNGIQVSRGATASIEDSTITLNDYTGGGWTASGILLYQAGDGVSITGNHVDQNDNNIYVQSSNSALIQGNIVENAAESNIYVYMSDAASILENTIQGAVLYDNIDLYDVNGATISGNDILGANYDGFWAGLSSNVSITDNVFSGNGIGSGASNAAGVHLADDNTLAGFVIHNNSFIGNTNGVVNEDPLNAVDATGNWWGDGSGPLDASLVSDSCGLMLDNPFGSGNAVSPCVIYEPWLMTAPGAGGGGGGDGGGDDRTAGGTQLIVPVTGGAQANVVSISGGASVTLDCTAFNETVLALSNGDHAVIPCPIKGDASLKHQAEDGLPKALPEGETYVSAMELGLAPDTEAVQALDATIGLHYALADGQLGGTFKVLHWDNGEWEQLDGQTTAEGYFESSHQQTGLYVLVSQ